MEGVAFSIRHCMEMINTNENDSPIPIGGGIAKSDIWCQIFADILNRPIVQLATEETETLGDIIIAAQALQIDEIKSDFGKILALKGKIKKPNHQLTDKYNDMFNKYKELYLSIKHLF